MHKEEIQNLLERQRSFFRTGATLPISFRIEQLKKLYSMIREYENEICEALKADLGKNDYEAFMCEIGLVLSEISYLIRHVKRFARQKSVYTPVTQFASRSFEKPVPYGNTLIMSPWNYPFLLSIDPLADAIAAGNTVMLKPSAYSSATSKVIEKIICACFAPEYVVCVVGGRNENNALLDEKFDFIFFTGSQSVGKEVLKCAASHLTPVVLELGGKSPCIVDESADVKLAAKRITFGKYLNCGQTCVAPDYILCAETIKDDLVSELKKQIKLQYGEKPFENKAYGKIINEKHFERICNLIDKEKVVIGGASNKNSLQIAPTVMDCVCETDIIMQEEIFGPVLPVLTFNSFDTVLDSLKNKNKPLALYIFSKDKKHIKRVTDELCYGGGCVNDVVIHLATSNMGFGGVGESGMGAYHGKKGFEAFSHTKSIIDKKTWIDLPMRYQPYKSKLYRNLLRLFLK